MPRHPKTKMTERKNNEDVEIEIDFRDGTSVEEKAWSHEDLFDHEVEDFSPKFEKETILALPVINKNKPAIVARSVKAQQAPQIELKLPKYDHSFVRREYSSEYYRMIVEKYDAIIEDLGLTGEMCDIVKPDFADTIATYAERMRKGLKTEKQTWQINNRLNAENVVNKLLDAAKDKIHSPFYYEHAEESKTIYFGNHRYQYHNYRTRQNIFYNILLVGKISPSILASVKQFYGELRYKFEWARFYTYERCARGDFPKEIAVGKREDFNRSALAAFEDFVLNSKLTRFNMLDNTGKYMNCHEEILNSSYKYEFFGQFIDGKDINSLLIITYDKMHTNLTFMRLFKNIVDYNIKFKKKIKIYMHSPLCENGTIHSILGLDIIYVTKSTIADLVIVDYVAPIQLHNFVYGTYKPCNEILSTYLNDTNTKFVYGRFGLQSNLPEIDFKVEFVHLHKINGFEIILAIDKLNKGFKERNDQMFEYVRRSKVKVENARIRMIRENFRACFIDFKYPVQDFTVAGFDYGVLSLHNRKIEKVKNYDGTRSTNKMIKYKEIPSQNYYVTAPDLLTQKILSAFYLCDFDYEETVKYLKELDPTINFNITMQEKIYDLALGTLVPDLDEKKIFVYCMVPRKKDQIVKKFQYLDEERVESIIKNLKYYDGKYQTSLVENYRNAGIG